nr:unnamed protein product [Callosobruchus analis]
MILVQILIHMVPIVNSANILGVFPILSYSHQLVFQTICKELSLRGHHVTVVTPMPLNDPTLTNLTEIDVSERVNRIFRKIDIGTLMDKRVPNYVKVRRAFELSYEVSEGILNDKRFIDVYNDSASNFDLVLMQSLFTPNLYPVAAKLSAPLVGVSSMGVWSMDSHNLVFQTIYKELSLIGHNVTAVTTRPLNDPTLTNLTEIDVSEAINSIFKKIDKSNFMGTGLSTSMKVRRAFWLAYEVSEAILSDKRFIDVYNNSASKFDVVLVQSLFSPILYPVAAKVNAPLELSLRGHHVTVVTPMPLNDPILTNLTEIDVSECVNRIFKKIDVGTLMDKGVPNYVKVRRAFELSYEVSEGILSDKRFIDVYNNSASNFDLVLMQSFFSPNLYPVAAKLNAPLVGVSSMGAWIGIHQAMGNLSPFSVYSDLFSLYYGRRLRLSEKLGNTVFYIWSSHQLVFHAIYKELSLRGHHMTVVTPKPLNDPTLSNLTEIDVNEAINRIFKKIEFVYYVEREIPSYIKMQKAFELSYEMTEAILSDKRFIDVYNSSTSKFDLVLVQSFISPGLYPIAVKLKVPLVGVSSLGAWLGTHQAMGNLNPLSMYSDFFFPYGRRLQLSEKLANTIFYIWSSHQIVFQAIYKELALQGHHVTVVTPKPLNDPTLTNLTEIDVSECVNRIFKKIAFTYYVEKQMPSHKKIQTGLDVTNQISEAIFSDKRFIDVYNNSASMFDVVLIQCFGSPTLYSLAAKLKAPLVGVSSLGVWIGSLEAMGNLSPLSLYSDVIFHYGRRMRLFEKLANTLYYIWTSHQEVFQPVWKELSLRGHQVTVVAPNPLQDPALVNLTEIDISKSFYKIRQNSDYLKLLSRELPVYVTVRRIFEIHQQVDEATLSDENFIEVYSHTNASFDLVIAQTVLSPTLHAVAAKLKVPLVGISSFGGYIGVHDIIGNPYLPSIHSDFFLPQHKPRSFLRGGRALGITFGAVQSNCLVQCAMRHVLMLPLLWTLTHCAHILGIFQMPSFSHQIVYQAIWKELALRGHQVTIVTSHPLKDHKLTNLREIDVGEATSKTKQEAKLVDFMLKDQNVYWKVQKLFGLHYRLAEAVLSDKAFIEIYNASGAQFDVVLAEALVSPILYAVAAKLKALLIGVASLGAWIGVNYAVGNPHPPSLYSDIFLSFHPHMTFFERSGSTMYYIWISHQNVYRPIWKELSLRGHQVILVTTHPMKDDELTNLTEVDVGESVAAVWDHTSFAQGMGKDMSLHSVLRNVFEKSYIVAEAIFSDRTFIEVYNNTDVRFDVVLAEGNVSPTMYAVAAKFKVPLVGVYSLGGWMGLHYAIGNPCPPSVYSELWSGFANRMKFSERLRSTLYYIWTSHQIVYRPIWKELSLRGHQVTLVTTHPMKDNELTNLTEIDIAETVAAVLGDASFPQILGKDVPLHSMLRNAFEMHYIMAEAIFSDRRFIKVYNSTDEGFDVVLTESNVSPTMYAVAAKFKVPLVGVYSAGAWLRLNYAIGNPCPPSLYSELWSGFGDRMKFSERLRSTLYYIWTSHQSVYQSIWKELSLKGHQVTIVTPFPLKDQSLTNLTEIDVGESISKAISGITLELIISKDTDLYSVLPNIFERQYKLSEAILSDARFIDIYNVTNLTFDVVLAEAPPSPILYAVAAKLRVPLVGVYSFGVWMGLHYSMGNPHPPRHQVTVITPNPLRDPALVNLTEIDVSEANYEIMQRHGFQFFMAKEQPVHLKIQRIFELNYELADAVLSDPRFIAVYNNSGVKFDLIIAQTYISPILYAVAAKVGVPFVGVASMGGWIGSHYALGNPNPPSLYSEMFLPYHGRMTFSERFRSTLYYLNFEAFPKCDQIARKYLGNDIPYIKDIEKNMSLLLLTTNPILYEPRPNVPTVISMEQMHIKPVKPLPKDLKQFLDSAKEAHPNVKVFVTQCGLQSIEEAVARGVPMVGMPFIADQTRNIRRLSEEGAAIGLEHTTLTKEEFKNAIIEVINNPK